MLSLNIVQRSIPLRVAKEEGCSEKGTTGALVVGSCVRSYSIYSLGYVYYKGKNLTYK